MWLAHAPAPPGENVDWFHRDLNHKQQQQQQLIYHRSCDLHLHLKGYLRTTLYTTDSEPRKSERKRYRCLFCEEHKGGTATSLVKHCLEEMQRQVTFVCSHCSCAKDAHTVHNLYNKSHRCWSKGYDFTAREFRRTLQEVKDALHRIRGVAPEMVDRIVRQNSARRKHRKTP